MPEPLDYEPPEPSGSDTAFVLMRAGINAVPYVGSSVAELLDLVLTPPLERRREAWRKDIAEGLRRLEKHNRLKIEDLATNESFVDTVLHASQVALRNHQTEKQEALRNAVLNAALPCAPDDSRQQMFIGLVDTLSAWHLRVLKLVADPLWWFQNAGRQPPQYVISSSLSRLVVDAWSELADQRDLTVQIFRDLYHRGLINTDGCLVNMSAAGAFEKRATALGEQFLKFIEAPR